MLNRHTYFILAITITFGILGAVMWDQLQHDNFVITYDGKSYAPQQITIDIGDTVTFTNESDSGHWPASDAHPSHSAYAAFDPLGAVPAGKSWSFTFDKAGVWGFHNHLQSHQGGTILVKNEDGSSPVNNCLNDPSGETCWLQILTQDIPNTPVAETMQHLAYLYETENEIPRLCHRLGHDIGLKYYIYYGTDIELTADIRHCANGFIHGYLEGYINDTYDLARISDFCTTLGETIGPEYPNIEGQCRHGIGHGLMEYYLNTEQDLWDQPAELFAKVVADCDRYNNTHEERMRCSSGGISVVLDWAESDKYFSKYIEPDFIYSICSAQEKQFAKEGCYWDATKRLPTSIALYDGENDVVSAYQTIKNHFPSEDRQDYFHFAIRSLGTMIGSLERSFKNTPAYYRDVCAQEFTTNNDERDLCYVGIAEGYTLSGTPNGEYHDGLYFCQEDNLLNSTRTDCFIKLQEVIQIVRPTQLPELCPLIESSYWQQPYCAV